MSKGEDIASHPVSETEDLQEDRAFLLDTHRAWKRTQPARHTTPPLPKGNQTDKSAQTDDVSVMVKSSRPLVCSPGLASR